MRCLLALCCLLLASSAEGRDGAVHTRDGAILRGFVRFDENHLVVADVARQSINRVPLTNVWFADLAVASETAELPAAPGPKRGPDPAPSRSFVPCVELTGGSTVVSPIALADPDAIYFQHTAVRRLVPVSAVANIRFDWIAGGRVARLRSGSPGALSTTGEFVEGDFRGLTNRVAVLSSVLFGVRGFDCSTDTAALVLRPRSEGRGAWQVRTSDGSRWFGEELEVTDLAVVLREPTLGRIRLPYHAVSEIWRP